MQQTFIRFVHSPAKVKHFFGLSQFNIRKGSRHNSATTLTPYKIILFNLEEISQPSP